MKACCNMKNWLLLFLFFLFLIVVIQPRVLVIKNNGFNGVNESQINVKPISLIFVGDIMFDRSIKNVVEKYGGGDFRFPFIFVADALGKADLTFGNLEGPISKRGKNQGSIYSFRMGGGAADALTFSGFDVMSLANNHILDWGKSALIDTISVLRVNNIDAIGAGKNYEEANSPVVKEIGNTKIAFLAYTNLYPKSLDASENSAGVSDFDLEKIKNKVKNIKETKKADLVILSLHWGEEYKTSHNLYQEKIAHDLIDTGADLIIGHHSHVIQELEQYKDKWIAYSLGNFLFDQNFSEETMRGGVLFVEIKNQKISKAVLKKVQLNQFFQPKFLE